MSQISIESGRHTWPRDLMHIVSFPPISPPPPLLCPPALSPPKIFTDTILYLLYLKIQKFLSSGFPLGKHAALNGPHSMFMIGACVESICIYIFWYSENDVKLCKWRVHTWYSENDIELSHCPGLDGHTLTPPLDLHLVKAFWSSICGECDGVVW